MAQRVWIVLEGPDMTYYGSAEIHGVFATQEAAAAKCLEVYKSRGPRSRADATEVPEYESMGVESWEVEG